MLQLKTCIALKEAGWSKETKSVKIENFGEQLFFSSTTDIKNPLVYPCPTLEELLEVVPKTIDLPESKIFWFTLETFAKTWHCGYRNCDFSPMFEYICNPNPSEAVASLILKLQAEGLINLKDGFAIKEGK